MKPIIKTIIAFGLLFPIFSYAAASSPGNSPANSIDNHIRVPRGKPITLPSTALPDALTAGSFSQDIDHSGQLSGQKFNQRYWIDSEYTSEPSTAPVLYHICGEGDAEQGYFLNDSAVEWAKTLGAHLVYLEHRYYGQSFPFSDISTDHLQYLTLDNVVEDLATFQKWISAQNGWSGKWISLGGSYSGTLSAIYRQKHPELVAGALASSAPMISGVGESVQTLDDIDGYSSTDISADTGGRQWIYQACTSLGFWEANGDDIHSTLENPSPWLCQQLFGNVALVDSKTYNQNYDTPFITKSNTAPSNILFTYGSDDVWTNIGLSTQINANPAITIRVINGAGHHFDLNAPDPSDTQEVLDARASFVSLARTWLSRE